ncbi:MAG: hypothetical protein EXS64_07630 [Candidatus Latescibacteria bacterium]|nr:hypothetical protein [Candidatus Latescibacterota bacterium]
MGFLFILLMVLVLIVGVKYYTAQVLLRQQRLLNEATEQLQEARGKIKLATNNLLVERRRESESHRTIEHLHREIAGLEEEVWKAEQTEKVEAELYRQKTEDREEGDG